MGDDGQAPDTSTAPAPIADASSIGGPQQGPQAPGPQQAPQAPGAPPPTPADASSIGGPQQAPQAGESESDLDVRGPQSFGHRVLSAVLTGLGGNNQVTYTVDPTTKQLIATQPTSGPGSQFKKIIAAAITGAAAGAGQVGPGAAGRAFSGGVNVVQQRNQAQQDQAKQEAYKAYDEGQKSKLQDAQYAMLTQQHAADVWELSRKKVVAGQQDEQFEDSRKQNVVQAGGYSVGHAPSFEDFLDMHKNDPDIVKAQGKGLLAAFKVYKDSPDGPVYNGVDIMRKPDDMDGVPLAKDSKMLRRVTPKTPGDPGPDGRPTWHYDTIQAGQMSAKEYDLKSAAAAAAKTAEDKQYNDAQEQAARTRQANASAKNLEGENATRVKIANIEAGAQEASAAARQSGEMPSVEDTAQQLYTNRQAVSQITTRGNLRQLAINRAEQIAQQNGTHFSPEANEIGYKMRVQAEHAYGPEGEQGKAIASFDALLGHALTASNMLNSAQQTGAPWLNTPLNKIKTGAGLKGSEEFAAYRASLAPVRDEASNFMNNGHVVHADEQKAMQTILDDNASPNQQRAAMKYIAGHMAVTKLASANFGYKRVTGENAPNILSSTGAEALRHFGVDPAAVYGSQTTAPVRQGANMGGSQQPPPPAGATGEVHDAKGNLIGHTVGNRFVALGAQ